MNRILGFKNHGKIERGRYTLTISQEQETYLQDTLSFWKELSPTQKDTIRRAMILKRFEEGDSMYGGSENCAGLFLIRKGQVRAFIVSEGGREITLYRLFDRDVCVFSASCMMRNITFEIHVEVEKPTEAFLIPTSTFCRLTQESIHIQSFTNQLMASRFSDVMETLEQVLFISLDHRLANYLLDQAIIEDSDKLKITHEKIANDLGTAREVVSRMLKYFQKEEMVLLNRGTIKLLNKDKLHKLAQG